MTGHGLRLDSPLEAIEHLFLLICPLGIQYSQGIKQFTTTRGIISGSKEILHLSPLNLLQHES